MYKKSKLNVYWPITAKVATSIQFSKMDHTSASNVQLTLNFHQILEVDSFWAIYVVKKRPKLLKKWQAHGCVLEVLAGGQLLMILHCVKVGLDSRCYDNSNTFFSKVPGGKEKSVQKLAFQAYYVDICW